MMVRIHSLGCKVTQYTDHTNSNRFIALDATLAAAIPNKDGSALPEYMARDDVTDRVLSNMQPFYQITFHGQSGTPNASASSSTIKSGQVPKIQILIRSRGGRKTTTTISGLVGFMIDPKSFAEALKMACASATSVDDIPGKPDDKKVMVQGNKVQQVMVCLRDFGLPCSRDGSSSPYVNIESKLK